MNKWSLTLLVILTATIIATLVFTSQSPLWAVSAPLLSIILGWLLKTINDSVTLAQQRQWELEKIAQERTLKYYESKLDEMSSFAIEEITKLTSMTWSFEDKIQFTKEWVTWTSGTRTFVEVIKDKQIAFAYEEVTAQSSKFLIFVGEFNTGKFNSYEKSQLQAKVQEEISQYMNKLKNFQAEIERLRLKVLRGEVTIGKNKTG